MLQILTIDFLLIRLNVHALISVKFSVQISLLKTVSCLKSRGSSCPPYPQVSSGVPGATIRSLSVSVRSFTIGLLPALQSLSENLLVGGFICSVIGLEIIVLPQSKQLFLTLYLIATRVYIVEKQSLWTASLHDVGCWLMRRIIQKLKQYAYDRHFFSPRSLSSKLLFSIQSFLPALNLGVKEEGRR